jgi:hypothetical protein
MDEKVIRGWRVFECKPSGLGVWFDPATERVKLFSQSPTDSEVAAVVSEGVDMGGEITYLDKVVSVSASELEREPSAQERFHQGQLFGIEETDLPSVVEE